MRRGRAGSKGSGSQTRQGAARGGEPKTAVAVAAVEDMVDQCVLDYFKKSERNKQPGHTVALKVACDDILFLVK